MTDAGRRPLGRLFYLLVPMMVAGAVMLAAVCAGAQNGPATTTVADTVYQADGTVASGNLIIFWPAFMTAGGTAVAPGVTTTTLGSGGALSVALVPNAGANPAGVYYSVVYQLGPAVASREIVDPVKFKDGISQIIDGTVMCLNASTWAKGGAPTSASAAQ
jgi:hypothetical protein